MTTKSPKKRYVLRPHFLRFAITIVIATVTGLLYGLFWWATALQNGLPLSASHEQDLIGGSAMIQATLCAVGITCLAYGAFLCVIKGDYHRAVWSWAHPHPETNPPSVAFWRGFLFLSCLYGIESIAILYNQRQEGSLVFFLFALGVIVLPAMVFGIERVRTLDFYSVNENGRILPRSTKSSAVQGGEDVN